MWYRKLDEQLRIQQERERAAEEKIARQREALRAGAPESPRIPREEGAGGAYVPPSRRADAPPSGGKYVPPTRREDGATGGYVPPARRGDAGPAPRGGDEGKWRPREDSGRGGDERPAASGWKSRAEAAGGEAPASGGWRARQEAAGGERAPSTPTQERWRPSGTRYDNEDSRREREGAPSPADRPAGGPPKIGSGKWRERVGSGAGSGASSGNEKGSGSDEGFTPVTRRR